MDDDTRQRVKGAAKFTLEFYKILMGCFLTVFVPHSCGETMCSFSHNLYGSTDGFHQVAVLTNTLCFLAFLAMYFCEITRENWCITYLDIDATKSNDNLDHAIERYPGFKRRMHALNANYQRSVAICSADRVLPECGGGMTSSRSADVMRAISSPSRPWPATSSRRSASRSASSGPWQTKHVSDRIGRTSRL